MALLDRLAIPLLLRQLNRTGASLDRRLAEQNLYLKRLADKFAPDLNTEPIDQQTRSIDFVEEGQQGRILDYVDRMVRELGREPTEDELVQFLDGTPVGRNGGS